MAEVYALLVGIDDYASPLPPLHGCVNDITDAHRYLEEAAGPRAAVQVLLNAQATRDAVIGTFRRHLGQAGPADTALFWFSGHGSLQAVPPEWWHLEPSGTTMQTMLCADSRQGDVPDLLDKELAILISQVAAGGPHVVVVLDCCHSGGGTRIVPAASARFTHQAPGPLDPARLIPELRSYGEATARAPDTALVDHVALAACESDQLAYELPDRDGNRRGVFSQSLLAALRRAGPAPTYRELMAATGGYVHNRIERQTPVLYPHTESIVDEPFLGGGVRTPAARMTMVQRRGGWVVDAGSCHGFVTGYSHEAARVAVLDSAPIQEAQIVRVFGDHSVVRPLGWEPVPGEVYPVVLSQVPMPATVVAIGGGDGDDADVAKRVETAIAVAAPGGRPSPHLRVVSWSDRYAAPDLIVSTPAEGRVSIRSTDDVVLANTAAQPAERVVAQLEHIAQWRQIRGLRNPLSRLAGLVSVELVAARANDWVTPRDRPGIAAGPDGTFEFWYGPNPTGWTPPTVFIRLSNHSDRRLHCVLLDLTDRFRIHAGLFPGGFIDPGASAAAAEGSLIELTLPDGRAPVPGAQVRDWLMLVVSEDKINSDCFALSRLGEPHRGDRAPQGLLSAVERLALAAQRRDLDRAPAAARDWWTTVIPVVTRIPG